MEREEGKEGGREGERVHTENETVFTNDFVLLVEGMTGHFDEQGSLSTSSCQIPNSRNHTSKVMLRGNLGKEIKEEGILIKLCLIELDAPAKK
jgi:hypothetical protein